VQQTNSISLLLSFVVGVCACLCEGLRGQGGDLLLLEEAGHISDAMLRINVVPMMLVKNTAVIAITTPGSEDAFFSQLISRKAPDGRPYFKYISMGLICDLCLRLGRTCVPAHVKISLPHFRSSADQEMAERLLGDNDDARRELSGIVGNTNRQYLFRDHLKLFKMLPEYTLQYPLDVLYVGVDPSGGGAASDYAICTMAHENDNWLLMGMDRTSGAEHHVIWNMLEQHLMKLRREPRTANALFMIFIESNMSYVESNRIAELFSQPRFAPVHIESRDKSKQMRAGVITTQESKILMAADLAKVMQHGKLVYWRDFHTQLETKDIAKREIEAQLDAYRRDARPSPDPARTAPIVTFSGKGGGNTRDDQCMALQITLHEARKKRENPEFIATCRSRHWRC
jgi:hypothetical protein